MLPSAVTQDLAALAQVTLIDVALAGDNAVVVGMAVAGLPAEQQRRAIIAGIGGATLIRIGFGAITLKLLEVIGLMLAGGLLLLWVCWKMYRELHRGRRVSETGPHGGKTLRAAMQQIIIADISMSLDNVLAVAGAARGSMWVLATGLVLSIALMGLAAGLIARLLGRVRWIAWAGLLMVLYIALRMIWEGSEEVAAHTSVDERISTYLAATIGRLRP
ncbi:MAG: YjbE family putative metal transport protein [Acetobacteraceae bacterium]|nr:YjbE family putative metal transport protein [Acetobacteraceae bacterium]